MYFLTNSDIQRKSNTFFSNLLRLHIICYGCLLSLLLSCVLLSLSSAFVGVIAPDGERLVLLKPVVQFSLTQDTSRGFPCICILLFAYFIGKNSVKSENCTPFISLSWKNRVHPYIKSRFMSDDKMIFVLLKFAPKTAKYFHQPIFDLILININLKLSQILNTKTKNE